MKKSKNIKLLIAPVLSTLLFNACGGNESVTRKDAYPSSPPPPQPIASAPPSESTTRDVYQSRKDCAKDWDSEELCQQMNADDDREYRRRNGSTVGSRLFWGPQYAPNNRTVLYQGRTITPVGKSTSLQPFVVMSRAPASSNSNGVSPRASSNSSTSATGGSITTPRSSNSSTSATSGGISSPASSSNSSGSNSSVSTVGGSISTPRSVSNSPVSSGSSSSSRSSSSASDSSSSSTSSSRSSSTTSGGFGGRSSSSSSSSGS